MANSKLKKFAVTAALVAQMTGLTAGCASDLEPGEDPTSALRLGRYDGKTFFNGVLFGIGPIAAMLPEMWSPEAIRAGLKELASLSPEEIAARVNDERAQESLASSSDVSKIAVPPPPLAIAQLITDQISNADPKFFPRFAIEITSGDHLRVDQALKNAMARITTAIDGSQLRADSSNGLFWLIYHFIAVVLPIVIVLDAPMEARSFGLKHDINVNIIVSRLAR